MSVKLTDSMRDALKWLEKRGGDGVVVRATSNNPESMGGKYTTLLAAGDFPPFYWATFKRLIKAGMLEEYQAGGGRRVRIARPA